MLDAGKRERFLKEALHIGDQLLKIAERDDHGLFWSTYGKETDGSVSKNLVDNILLGTAGPAIFFSELFKQTCDGKYLDAAREAANWLVHHCRIHPSDFYSFNTGRLGVAFTLQKISKITGDHRFSEEALRIASACDDFFKDSRLVSTWNNGASGAMVALLHLHNETGESWLLEKAGLFASYLVDEARKGKQGLYWDRSHQNISGLCGFASGASGVAFGFLELGKYTGNEAYYWLARQAFWYEEQYYIPSQKNWQDLRKVFRKFEDFSEHCRRLQEGDSDFFFKGECKSNWSYGAAGIAMSRMHAYALTGDESFVKEAIQALETAVAAANSGNKKTTSYVLADGHGGVVDLLLKAMEVFGNAEYYDKAQKIAESAIEQRVRTGAFQSALLYKGREGDNSLFLSSPGIGYMLLRLLAPREVPSVLLPEVNGSLNSARHSAPGLPEHLTTTLPVIKQRIYRRYFSRSMDLAEIVFPDRLRDFFHGDNTDFTGFLEREIEDAPKGKTGELVDRLRLEKIKWQMDITHSSHIMLHVKELIKQQKAEKWHHQDLSPLEMETFALDEDIELFESDQDNNVYLLKPTAYGIVENPLSPFTSAILDSFSSPTPVSRVIDNVITLFGELEEKERIMLQEKILEQIKMALVAGFLREIR